MLDRVGGVKIPGINSLLLLLAAPALWTRRGGSGREEQWGGEDRRAAGTWSGEAAGSGRAHEAVVRLGREGEGRQGGWEGIRGRERK